MRKILSLCLAAALVLLSATAAFAASEESWGEYSMENDGYGYLTANFPAVYPAEVVEREGTQVVSEKADAILLTITDAETLEMLASFAGGGVAWQGIARMGIPAVREGEPVFAPDVFTSFDTEAIEASLTELAMLARADGYSLLCLEGLERFPEPLAQAAAELFAKVMNENGVVAWIEEQPGAGAAGSEEMASNARDILSALGAAGYLRYMQVSRDGRAALDGTPPREIVPEAVAYAAPAEAGDYALELPETAKAGESLQIVAAAPADVVSAMLRDENGQNFPVDDMLKENLGDSLRFTFTLHVDEAGAVPVYLYTMTTSGWSETPAVSAVLNVQ